MSSEQIRAYRQATADRAAAEQGRTVHDQEMIASHDRAVRSGLRVLRDIDHEQALLDNLPCELCGRHEAHGNHRGIGHTHTPAEDRVSRAALLLNTMPDVPGYIAASARMMLGSRNPGEIVDMDHAEALMIDHTFYPMLRGGQVDAWTAARNLGHPAAPHSTRWSATECDVCGRRVHNRLDENGAYLSSAHLD